jgi:hypothetical protein
MRIVSEARGASNLARGFIFRKRSRFKEVKRELYPWTCASGSGIAKGETSNGAVQLGTQVDFVVGPRRNATRSFVIAAMSENSDRQQVSFAVVRILCRFMEIYFSFLAIREKCFNMVKNRGFEQFYAIAIWGLKAFLLESDEDIDLVGIA